MNHLQAPLRRAEPTRSHGAETRNPTFPLATGTHLTVIARLELRLALWLLLRNARRQHVGHDHAKQHRRQHNRKLLARRELDVLRAQVFDGPRI